MAAVGRLIRSRIFSCSTVAGTSSFALRRWSSSSAFEADRGSWSPPTAQAGVDPTPGSQRKELIDRNVQWIFLGSPGVGKGTYASRLSQLLDVAHIATGDLVREELNSTGPLAEKLTGIVNEGKLVSDDIIFGLLSKRLEIGEAKGESGFILDGFPRTIKQAEILDKILDIDLVVNLKIREDVLVQKCLGRRICSQCGKNFNVACIDVRSENGMPAIYMAPLLPPERCVSKLISRADDTEEVVKERLRIYNEMSLPVEDYYRKQGKVTEFELPGGVPESWPKLLHALNLDDNDYRQVAAA